MEITLSPDIQEVVERRAACGEYRSASDMVEAGLRLPEQEQAGETSKWLEYARREVAVGLAEAERGEVEPLDIEEMLAEAHRRHAEEARV